MSYNRDEQRVCNYLEEITQGQVGCGDDPIGFLIASHAYLRGQDKNSVKVIARLSKVLEWYADLKNYDAQIEEPDGDMPGHSCMPVLADCGDRARKVLRLHIVDEGT